jgi:N-acetylglucosaminyldiphosphoundecaprenol N-acetyl-beta-D-mannosaminyltransferase
MSDFEAVDFLGIRLARVTTREFAETLIAWAKAHRRARVTYINAMCVNQAADDADYRRCLQSADLVYADGQSVVWAARRFGSPVPERVNAGDFFVEFCRRCAAENLSLFLLGSSAGRAEAAAGRLLGEAPGLSIVGTHHGYLTPENTPHAVAAINAVRPNLLIVGMGVPLQERWLWRHWEEIDVPVAWCVGALFDYLAGAFPRAPVWMRRAGLEWLFRLALEPRRLGRRYLIGNPRFVWRVLRRRSLSVNA